MRRALLIAAPLAVIALVVTWLVEPNLIVGLRSPQALAWAAGLGAVCALVGLVAWRLTGRPAVALALAALPGLIATGVFVVRPILSPRTLDEALPNAVATSTPTAPPTLTPTVDTSGPAGTAAPSSSTAPTGSTPQLLAKGALRGLAGHDASGTVATYRLADGSHIIRFEQVDIGGTPSPHVYVVPGADKRKKAGLHLGELKAEKGSFNYVLPAGFPPRDFTVLVWCEQFAVEIANATQS